MLITGWYGAKLRLRNIVRLIIDCAVFGMLSYLILIIAGHDFLWKEMVLSSFFTKNWFVVSYMMLLFSAPIIEASLKDANNNTLLVWLVFLTILNLYFGYYLKQVNTNGYNYIQFIWLYYIARYLKMSKSEKWYQISIRYSILSYVIFSMLLAAIYIFACLIGRTPNSLRWFAYNNPLLMLSSVSMFIWFSNLSFESKMVNWFATGVFGVFLLHTTPFMIPFRNSFTQGVFSQYGYYGVVVEAFAILFVGGIMSVYINNFGSRLTRFVSSKLETGLQAVGRIVEIN